MILAHKNKNIITGRTSQAIAKKDPTTTYLFDAHFIGKSSEIRQNSWKNKLIFGKSSKIDFTQRLILMHSQNNLKKYLEDLFN